MTELHLPWLELAILTPLLGALALCRLKDPQAARRECLIYSGLSLLFAVGAWQDFGLLHATEAEDRWHLLSGLLGGNLHEEVLVIDQLSAPLLPLVALLYFLTTFATLRTKIKRFSFIWTLIAEAITLATLTCQQPWWVIGLLALGTIPPLIELHARMRSVRIYVIHMTLFVVALVVGQTLVDRDGLQGEPAFWAIMPLLLAVFIRSGLVPFHLWTTDLFENATFGTALLFVAPITGAYAAVRLVLPIAPEWALQSMATFSLFTAVYAAGMALIQREARRFFCYLFLSHAALVLVGLETGEALGFTGGLCVWLSVALSLGGLGLTLRALEARRGRLSLTEYQGLYEHMPSLAVCFVLTGLASVGFPGTIGFIGAELLIDGVVERSPFTGVLVVSAAALNGIAIIQVYYKLFTGTHHYSTVSLGLGGHERFAVLTLAALMLLGGLVPQPGVMSRNKAAQEILKKRDKTLGLKPKSDSHSDHDEKHDKDD